MTKRYAYFFTRQDMIPEQQIVQTAHAALKLGYKAKEKEVEAEIAANSPPLIDSAIDKLRAKPLEKSAAPVTMNPDETYFTVVGVWGLPALEAVQEILDKFGFEYETFVEPDIGDQATSIAVYPVDEDKRGPLLAFNLLKITRL